MEDVCKSQDVSDATWISVAGPALAAWRESPAAEDDGGDACGRGPHL